MWFLRIPLRIRLLGLDELNPLEILPWNLTLLFGRETVAKWQSIVQEESEDAYAHFHLGILLNVEKRYEEAITAYRQALRMLPPDDIVRQSPNAHEALNAQIHYTLGNTLLAFGRLEEGRTEWEKVLEIEPDGLFSALARKQLAEFPEDGSTPRRKYILVVADEGGNVLSREFDDKDAAYQEYEGLKASIRDNNLGVGLAQFHPDGMSFEGAWIESRKSKEMKKRFLTLFHQHLGVA